MSKPKLVLPLLLAGMLALAPGVGAQEDGYPIEAGTEAECIQLRDANGNLQTVWVPLENGTAEGDAEGGRRCFDSGSVVNLTFVQSEVHLGSTRANAAGDYRIPFEIPGSAQPGNAAIRASGQLNGQPVAYTQAITIRAAAAARARGPRLPVTGSDIAMLAMWGLGFVAVGTVLVRTARRKIKARSDS